MNRLEMATRTVNELGAFLDVYAPSLNVSMHPHGYEKEVLIGVQIGNMVTVNFWVIENNVTPMSGEAVKRVVLDLREKAWMTNVPNHPSNKNGASRLTAFYSQSVGEV
jgi:hypothetical protein